MEDYIKGRGSQINTRNRFSKHEQVLEHFEGIDELPDPDSGTEVFVDHPKQIVNKIDSPDLPFLYSLNPYQGCEHGCSYCYARNAHQYWGFSAGLDFERKIIVKPDAARLLKKFFGNKNYTPASISMSGNTDCYQPLERKYRITRSLLEVFLQYRHPVGIITKNALILRDLDLLKELASMQLVQVYISLTTLNEELRRIMEPRTASSAQRLKVIETFSANGIPVGVMTAPIIPGLNSDEIPQLLKAAADHGALAAGYTMVRLNGSVKEIFGDWLIKNRPDAAQKVWNHIKNAHGGSVSDSRSGTRMRGEGNMAESVSQVFKLFSKKYFEGRHMPEYNMTHFLRPGQMSLF
ncbi:MAG TPA: PA0069 family radical SAM protein [Bacteroidia bacterium]|nr:PA0069 family radical SAM protein [Bacteroidia bacterium]